MAAISDDGTFGAARMGDDLLAQLASTAELRRRLDEFEQETLKSARDQGASLEAIAQALGISRQAVHRRLERLRGAVFVAAPHMLGDWLDIMDALPG